MKALSDGLCLERGRSLYEAFIRRPSVAGGARPTTIRRYKAVLDKFFRFGQERGITTWSLVTRTVLESYATWLLSQGYAYRTQYFELTTIKQMLKWLIENEHLSESKSFAFELRKPQGTSAYCWRPCEVGAMIEHCAARPELH